MGTSAYAPIVDTSPLGNALLAQKRFRAFDPAFPRTVMPLQPASVYPLAPAMVVESSPLGNALLYAKRARAFGAPF